MNIKNKQRAKLALAELEKEMEILSKEDANACKGGGDGSYQYPFTLEEYEFFSNFSTFSGGWVQDPYGNIFYGLGNVTVVAPSTGSSGYSKNSANYGVSGNYSSKTQNEYERWWENVREQNRNPIIGTSGIHQDQTNESHFYIKPDGSTGVYGYDSYNSSRRGGSIHYQDPIKGKGGKYDGVDLSKIQNVNNANPFYVDVLHCTKLSHNETISLFNTLYDRTSKFEDILAGLGLTGILSVSASVKDVIKELGKGRISSPVAGALITYMTLKVGAIESGNESIRQKYEGIHKDSPENMKGIYQIYEKKGSGILLYEDVTVHYYDVHTGQYLGKVD